jgi:hypothetical protein
MSEAKHTKGPWQQEGSYIYGPDPLRLPVCQMRYLGRGYQEELAANESLIKAAPDLLEVLKNILKHGGSTSGEWVPQRFHDAARAAIAKAGGGEDPSGGGRKMTFKNNQKIKITDAYEKALIGRTGTVVRLLKSTSHQAWVNIDGDPIPYSVREFPADDPAGRGNHVLIYDDECEPA